MMKRIALSFLSLASIFAAYPQTAHAQHKSPLADAPAIRKRVELRDKRFEISVGAGSTLNETFYHDILLQGHLAFHITDWLSIGGVGIFGVTTLSTGFNDELLSTLTSPPAGRAPDAAAAKAGMNKPSSILLGQLEVTPFTGKFSLFGKLFAHYDFYIAPGAGLVTLAKANSATAHQTIGGATITDCADTSNDPTRQTCVLTGSQVAGSVAVGFHSFFNDYFALNVELRDVINKDNPAGRDVNADQFVDKRDLTWTQHWMATLGLSVYFPKADISP
jgi:outer membrane beta-barrel protein